MQRYFVTPAMMSADAVSLEGDDARHLATVMRSKPGDCFIACDGQGREALAKIVQVDKNNIQAQIIEELSSNVEMGWRITVAQSLPKGDKLETVIQKGTEAGAAVFTPFLSARTIVQYDERKEAKRIERWRKIAKEAAEQSHRALIPEVSAVCSWKALLTQFPAYDLILFCYEEEGRKGVGLRDIVEQFQQRERKETTRILIVIGPEGGFTQQEADAAVVAGASLVGLGKRILRTETAALYALACLAYASGELGGMNNG
ncbi:MAG: 16S rRNA (uracil(1498)-N(3))-methyltransferase [Candidatus Cohnella colombiensis]|uniref:Ribosomal RNA small subunit methyltransferase E n=1 Tax=Candidatus Cohnella colombiensis TaxID=3121368 RepID=A0AA95EU54_9BACL|nr:MAG: 16S rRNA (uracil(1498)-N(3))-methyltransferase [Cohnella sp.]